MNLSQALLIVVFSPYMETINRNRNSGSPCLTLFDITNSSVGDLFTSTDKEAIRIKTDFVQRATYLLVQDNSSKS